MPAYKNQHYVPQSILKRFQNDKGELFYFYKRAPKKPIIHRNTGSIFSKNHMYSFEEKNGTRNTDVEADFFKQLDTKVDPILTKIVSDVRNNLLPQLSIEEKKIWNDFYIKQHSRIPERFFSADVNSSLDKNYEKTKREIYDRCSPELQKMLDDPKFEHRVKVEAKAKSLTSDLLQSAEILADRGLYFARISNPKKSFIIGSNPLVRCGNGGSGYLGDDTTELWYPVAHDIAVSTGSHKEAETLFVVGEATKDVRFINRVNGQIFEQSNEIAGRSKALIESITRHLRK